LNREIDGAFVAGDINHSELMELYTLDGLIGIAKTSAFHEFIRVLGLADAKI
jgi:hypothetical protein